MLKVAVVTVSDRASAGIYEDISGPTVADLMKKQGAQVVARYVVPDEPDNLVNLLRHLVDDEDVHLIFTTGGTGPAPRDWTPEATRQVIEREMPGLAELLRWDGYKRTPWTVLGRGVAGIRRRTLIINLPGNPQAVKEGIEILASLLPPLISLMRGGPFHPDMRANECCPEKNSNET